MRVAALVKQIPAFDEMELGADGRLRRDGLDLEMNPYCRRAVSQAVEMARAGPDGRCCFFSLGPPSAMEVLREAVAWASDRRVAADGILITDAAFAGSDTLATARALAAALQLEGPFDVVLVGRNSVDADTGQVGPEVAELLDLAFLGGVRHLEFDGGGVRVRCEQDDGWTKAEVTFPVLISTAERLIEPCKVDASGRAEVSAERLRTLTAHDLGPGPWGQDGSPTTVGPTRVHRIARQGARLEGDVAQQVRQAVGILAERGALVAGFDGARNVTPLPPATPPTGPAVAVVVEPDRSHLTQELLGVGAELAARIGGHVVAFACGATDVGVLASQGADAVMRIEHAEVAEDVSSGLATWASHVQPWAVLVPATAWGREVAGRAAARLGAGLTGDAIALEADGHGRLMAWKPAFGGQLVAGITARSAVQMATVRPGVLPRPRRRGDGVVPEQWMTVAPRRRVRVLASGREDDLDILAEAHAVIGVGVGVDPSSYDVLDPLLTLLGAELGATRKVTDNGWLPHDRQIGITGRSIAPRLYVALGLSGKFNHMVGVRSAGTVVAVNSDPDALVFQSADVCIVADWQAAVAALVDELERLRPADLPA